MGHPGDWDDVRAALPEIETFAVAVKPASDWNSSIRQLTESVSHRSILVGYSMGARLALGMALEYPDRFDGLVFISGNPGLESQAARDQRRDSDEQVARRIEEGHLDSFLEQWYRAEVFTGLPEELRRAEIKRKLSRDSNDWPAILRTHSVSQQPNYWPILGQLSIPTIAVAGERDEKYRQIMKRIESEFGSPTLSAKIVPHCGHMVHRENPEALIQIICDAIQARRRRASE